MKSSASPPAAKTAVGNVRVQANSGVCGKGDSQPPKNKMVARQETVIMLAYSAMKNMANLKLAYSV